MDTTTMTIGAILIPDDTVQSVDGRMGSAIKCIFLDEKGYRFKKMHLNSEEFFLTVEALKGSHWIDAPIGSQLRFL